MADASTPFFMSLTETGPETWSKSLEETGERLLHEKTVRVQSKSGTTNVYYPVFHEGLPEEFKHIAEQDLGETAANRERGLRKLKKFMKEEKLSATDGILITVLRACKYDLKKSEDKLKKFLRLRQNITEKLSRVDEKKIDLILQDTMFTILPYRDGHGRVVFVTKPTINLDKYSMSDVEPIVMSLVLYLLTFPMTTACGFAYLLECKCDSIYVYYPIIKAFKPYVAYSMNLPVRIRRVDLVNENVIVRTFYNAFSAILPTKLTKRIFFHGNSYEGLHRVYPPDILPVDMEGNLEPFSDGFYRERLIKFMKTLKEEALNR